MRYFIIIIVFILINSNFCYSQNTCPPNIGFEYGNFDNWKMYSGFIQGDGILEVLPYGRQQVLLKIEGNSDKDRYGDFPVIPPNGSKYSVKLGNELAGREVDQLIYEFKVPENIEGYSIVFNYAVVLENPNHDEKQQPRFTVKVYNQTRNQYLDCSSFDFVAGFSQPDFIESPYVRNVFYKPWASATITLNSYKGENLHLEFSVNDCSLGAHFGYAYLDVIEKCTNSVTGNIICDGITSTILNAPVGFADYSWYKGDFSQQLGNSFSYSINNPVIGDSFAVVIIPNSYLGCRDTVYTQIKNVGQPITLHIKNLVEGCSNEGADLTKSDIYTGSSTNLKFEYFTNSSATEYIQDPKKVIVSGRYFIKGFNEWGCELVKPIDVLIHTTDEFKVVDPPPGNYSDKINLTNIPDNPNLVYTYWEDNDLKKPLINPDVIQTSGVYFIKGTNVHNCSIVESVTVKISAKIVTPNAFTPNNDGLNDIFNYKFLGGLKTIDFFKIYNRWGKEIFSSNELNKGWDGRINGQLQPAGVYLWILKGKDWTGNSLFEKGTVMLIR